MASLQAAIDDVRPATPTTADTARTRVDFNDAAKALFSGSLAGWRAAVGVERRHMATELLANAQAPGMQATLGSAAWSIATVTTAMNNALRRANKRRRMCSQAE